MIIKVMPDDDLNAFIRSFYGRPSVKKFGILNI